ncbi:membrane cofactor protein-like isoform X2 [Gymnodraco acuticeps]|uniref:Membrane cofactor protein-like isoform X2 n=1 Tax=Gymnodraco acuticeps TaxID=8218 RepID=A0A6P8UEX4_GYMAC|nr:membrane cofactor protein-like isoform X2 [Gymnodraco acuticeps]
MAASFLLLLTCVGLFLSAQAQDCSSPVGGDNMGLKGNDILLQSFPDGTKVTFACDVGYVTAGGSASITCTAGDWSSLRMTCKRKQCGAFEDVPNGSVDYSEGNEFGDKLTVTCKPGYDLVGNPNILCGNEGWMGRPPVCEEVDCKEPVVGFGHWDSGSRGPYTYKATVTFKCNEGYRMTNSATIICGINELWEPALPKCEAVPADTTTTTKSPESTTKPTAVPADTTTTTKSPESTTKPTEVDCKEPVVGFGHWDSGSRGPYTYKATVTFKCNEGYRMTNSATIICGINELWEPALPKCEAGVPTPHTISYISPNQQSTTSHRARRGAVPLHGLRK